MRIQYSSKLVRGLLGGSNQVNKPTVLVFGFLFSSHVMDWVMGTCTNGNLDLWIARQSVEGRGKEAFKSRSEVD